MVRLYTTLFMEKPEQESFQIQDQLTFVQWRYKYINEVIATWTHGKPGLCLFVDSLNAYHTSIKLRPPG